jgi:hypothetical protein
VPFTKGVVEIAGEAGTVDVTVGVAVTAGGVWFRLTSSTSIRLVPVEELAYVNAMVWLAPFA